MNESEEIGFLEKEMIRQADQALQRTTQRQMMIDNQKKNGVSGNKVIPLDSITHNQRGGSQSHSGLSKNVADDCIDLNDSSK